jgi:hypothetical protein
MVLVLAACIYGLGVAVLRADDYVKGRGEYRDQEQARMQQELNDLACGMLDTLPEDQPLLRPMRDKYHCGPGVPISELPPEIQRELGFTDAAPTIEPQPLTSRPDLGLGLPPAGPAVPGE